MNSEKNGSRELGGGCVLRRSGHTSALEWPKADPPDWRRYANEFVDVLTGW